MLMTLSHDVTTSHIHAPTEATEEDEEVADVIVWFCHSRQRKPYAPCVRMLTACETLATDEGVSTVKYATVAHAIGMERFLHPSLWKVVKQLVQDRHTVISRVCGQVGEHTRSLDDWSQCQVRFNNALAEVWPSPPPKPVKVKSTAEQELDELGKSDCVARKPRSGGIKAFVGKRPEAAVDTIDGDDDDDDDASAASDATDGGSDERGGDVLARPVGRGRGRAHGRARGRGKGVGRGEVAGAPPPDPAAEDKGKGKAEGPGSRPRTRPRAGGSARGCRTSKWFYPAQ
jgi:hypothetical protein